MKIAYMVISDAKVPMGLFSEPIAAMDYLDGVVTKIASGCGGVVSTSYPDVDGNVLMEKSIRTKGFISDRWGFAVVKIVLDLNSNL